MLTHKNIVSTILSLKYTSIDLFASDTHISYLPLPHIFERCIIWLAVISRSRIVFYKGDPLKLGEDFQIVKPTVIFSVPRIYNKFYGAIMDNI
jgi:long-chain acyl-CoA synthetase